MTQQITIELDDKVYQSLSQQVGQDNLATFFKEMAERYSMVNSTTKVTDFKSPLHQDSNISGVFDEFFGVLTSDKSVSLADMDKAIAQRGGQL